jgi:hypothetical protein
MRKLLFFTTLIGAIVSCKQVKPVASSTTGEVFVGTPAEAYNGGNFILAVILKAERKHTDSAIKFSIVSAAKKPGKLKPMQDSNTGKDYIVSFTNSNDEVVASYTISHPLDIYIESSEESGALQTTPVKKNEAVISLRTNYKPEIQKMIIRRIMAGDTNKIIIPLNIK